MNIHFAWSIRGWSNDKELYCDIIKQISAYWNVLTEHLRTEKKQEEKVSDTDIYTKDTNRINSSNIFIAEVSTPSLWVWYEIWYAESQWISVYCLYRTWSANRLSAMIRWNATCSVYEYTNVEDIKKILEDIFTS